MSNKMLFSVLIPNLGYSHLLFECLDSVVYQEINDEFNYEIVLCDQSDLDIHKKINDEIVSRYGKDTINFIHSDIKSLYQARHTLMKYANGEYIIFIDSDDFVDKNYLNELYKIIEINKPDIIFTNYKRCSYDGTKKVIIKKIDNIKKERLCDCLIYSNFINSLCIKIFKKNLYNFNDYEMLKFDGIRCGEDKLFSIPIVKKMQNSFLAKDFYYYNYRNNPKSMVKNPSLNDFKNLINCLFLYADFSRIDDFQKEMLSDFVCDLFLILSQKHNKTKFAKFRKYVVKLQTLIEITNLKPQKTKLKFKKFFFLTILKMKLYFILYIASFFI